MEYGEAIGAGPSEQALEIARCKLSTGRTDVHQVAAEAVAGAYCVCVVDGEDAAEGQLSAIHASLIDEIQARLRKSVTREGS